MSENITTIKDPTVYIKPSEKLVNFLKENYKALIITTSEIPENVKCLIENEKNLLKSSDIDWMNQYLISKRNKEKTSLLTGKELYDEIDKIINNKYSGFDFDGYLEEKNKNDIYLHDLMEGSELILPKNEIIKRNPILEERIKRLKKEQEEREYKEMTKNVDTKRKNLPEDTVSYQMKMMNRHLIAVLQFLVSVGAGFAFGFIGLELVIGDLNFGVRLLMVALPPATGSYRKGAGIEMCDLSTTLTEKTDIDDGGITFAVIIAIAEFYFLAKHLNEEEKQETEETEPKPQPSKSSKTKRKLHAD